MTYKRSLKGNSTKALAVASVVLAAMTSFTAPAAAGSHDAQTPADIGTSPILDTTTVTLVSNHDQQDPDGFLLYSEGSVFQGFTTGSNPGGYSLSQVSVIPQQRTPDPDVVTEMSAAEAAEQLRSADATSDTAPAPPAPQLSVEIWSQKGTNITMPDEHLYRLIAPSSATSGEPVAFRAPSDTVLDPNTSYYVRISNAIQLGWDTDPDPAGSTADGWRLINGLMYRSEGASAWANFNPNAIVSISGFAVTESTQ